MTLLNDTLARILNLLRHPAPSAEVVVLGAVEQAELPKLGFEVEAAKGKDKAAAAEPGEGGDRPAT